MSCVDFNMLGSSGTKLNLEHQPARQILQTKNYVFGYQFEPSLGLEGDLKAIQPRVYNPMADLLNPVRYLPDEVLKLQSKEYMEEQLLKEKFAKYKSKSRLLSLVPERLRGIVERLFDDGLINSEDTSLVNQVIREAQSRGELTEGDAIQLRNLVSRKSTFSQLAQQARDLDTAGELNPIVLTVSQSLINSGVNPTNARYIAQRAISATLDEEDFPPSGVLPIRRITERAISRSFSMADGLPDSFSREEQFERFEQQQADVVERNALNPVAHDGFASRSSASLIGSPPVDLSQEDVYRNPRYRQMVRYNPTMENVVPFVQNTLQVGGTEEDLIDFGTEIGLDRLPLYDEDIDTLFRPNPSIRTIRTGDPIYRGEYPTLDLGQIRLFTPRQPRRTLPTETYRIGSKALTGRSFRHTMVEGSPVATRGTSAISLSNPIRELTTRPTSRQVPIFEAQFPERETQARRLTRPQLTFEQIRQQRPKRLSQVMTPLGRPKGSRKIKVKMTGSERPMAVRTGGASLPALIEEEI